MPAQIEINSLIDHLFRHETGKMVAVLTRIFGPEHLELAEDVVQDSLVEAIKQWSWKGIPDDPSAWLFRVAKNKAINIINREKYKRRYASDIIHLLQSEWTVHPAADFLFSEQEILDDQLRMMFTCCHPSISSDSQVALILKTLCGFSIPEIAKAFLTNEENISKRLVRARQKIRESEIPFEIPASSAIQKPLNTILEAIYLLFNEGYSASSGQDLIRYEVCEEAIRLTALIAEHPAIHDKANVHALLALMQLNASRFKARQGKDGQILTLEHQDRSQWDFELMKKGFVNLDKSVDGPSISIYHILASISFYHCSSPDYASTNWLGILSLYDKLIETDHSPVILLNRAVALAKVHGPAEALAELEKLKNNPVLENYHLFYSVQAELLTELERFPEAIVMFRSAIAYSSLDSEKSFLENRMSACSEKIYSRDVLFDNGHLSLVNKTLKK